jgi:hypothetical protein
MHLLRTLEIIVTAPARVMMRRLSANLPHQQIANIEMRVISPGLASKAQPFFTRTIEAINYSLAELMPKNSQLRRNIRQIILTDIEIKPFYHRFQLAIFVTPYIALEVDKLSYAVWLLYVSCLSLNKRFAQEQLDKLLNTLEPAEGLRIREWLVKQAVNEDTT